MNLMPIAQALENAGLGMMGQTIFINMIPIECPQGILLRSPLSGTKIDYELPGYYRTKFQLIVRAGSYAAGEALAASVFAALTIKETQLGTMYVRYMRPMTKPAVFPLSKGNLLEFAAYFDVVFNE